MILVAIISVSGFAGIWFAGDLPDTCIHRPQNQYKKYINVRGIHLYTLLKLLKYNIPKNLDIQ